MVYRARTYLILFALLAGGVCLATAVSGEQDASDSPPTAKETEPSADARKSGTPSGRGEGLGAPGDYLWLMDLEPPPDAGVDSKYDRVRQGKVSTRKMAERAVSSARSDAGERGTLDGHHAVALICIRADVPGFAARGDMIWVVWALEGLDVKQEAWVSSSTGKIRWMLPFPAEKPTPDAPAGATEE